MCRAANALTYCKESSASLAAAIEAHTTVNFQSQTANHHLAIGIQGIVIRRQFRW